MKVKIFTRRQIERVANIFDNAGQVFLATVALPTLIKLNLNETPSKILLILGIVGPMITWWAALRLERILEKV